MVRLRFFAIAGTAVLSQVTLGAQTFYATPYKFTTVAGDCGYGTADGNGIAARFYGPLGVAVDGAGNVYVADSNNHTIRKISPAGAVTTFAGLAGTPGSADGTGSAARFNHPRGVAVDSGGSIYVTDVVNQVIRKITPAGVVTTLAGSVGNPGSADGTGPVAQFNYPQRLAVDGSGVIYVADTVNSTIRKITPGGEVTTLAGSPGLQGSTDDTGSAARFNLPTDVAVDSAGNVYVADRENHTIRKISSGGTVTTLAGTVGSAGAADGTGTGALFNWPTGLTVDSAGNVFVADTYNNTIRKITPGGVVTTLAGLPTEQGSADGTGSAARFYWPSGLTVDGAGNIFVADEDNSSIRMVTSAGVVTTFAGSTGSPGSADGSATAARFRLPTGVAVDGAGNIFVADQQNQTVRKIATNGAVTTFAGLAGDSGGADGAGAAARFNYPRGVAVDTTGNVYVADDSNHTIRKITVGGVVTTLAGTAGSPGAVDLPGAAAKFNRPEGVAVDSAGNVFVADELNHTIRKITSTGFVSTLAGSAGNPGFVNGTGSAARFNNPFGVAVDGSGNVYVADTANHAIRKISSDGSVSTLAGGNNGGINAADGPGNIAQFGNPTGVAVDAAGNVYVADQFVMRIRKVTSAGFVTTLAGGPVFSGASDGAGVAAGFLAPQGIAVDSAGNVYVADTSNNTIRKGTVVVRGDFSGDQQVDLLWQNTTSGDRGFWLMNGTGVSSWVEIGLMPTDWRIAATADFNGDGQTDLLWENTVTGDRGFWLMNGTTFSSWVDIGIVSTDWHIAAAADFTGDGQPDILWENTVTGDRGFWIMNGTTFSSWWDIGVIPTTLKIVGAADFNADGSADIIWENTATGKRVIWLMRGPLFSSSVNLGIVSTDWHIAAVADYNGDGQADILWENTVTGERGFWLMNGTAFSSWQSIGVVSTDWKIAN